MGRRWLVTAWAVASMVTVATAGSEVRGSGSELRVSGVVDGATLEVLGPGGLERIRLLGATAPAPGNPLLGGEYHGDASRDGLVRLALARGVRIEEPRTAIGRHARPGALVWLGDTLLNEAVLRRGIALLDACHCPLDRIFEAWERDARRHRRGMWDHSVWRREQEAGRTLVVPPVGVTFVREEPLAERAKRLSGRSPAERRRALEEAVEDLAGEVER